MRSVSANANQDSRGSGPISISLPGMTLMVSKPGGGKSHLAKYLIYLNRSRIKHAIAFSKSAFRPGNIAFMPNYTGMGKDAEKYFNFKHMRYDKNVLREFLEGQARYPEGQRPLGLIYFDDDISEAGMFNDEYVIDAATMYRQYNVWVIIATQHVNKVSTTVRECASEVALFKMDSKRAIEAAYESYGQDFEDYKAFKAWLFMNTTPAEEHNFCWKDKMNDKPWEVLRAPAQVPEFRLDYGKKCECQGGEDKKKKSRPRKRKRKDSQDDKAKGSPLGNEFAALQKITRWKGASHPNPLGEERMVGAPPVNKKRRME